MTTDVSITPRGGRPSTTGRRILIDHRVDILPKASTGDAGRAEKGGQDSVGRHEHALAKRTQLRNRDAIARDDEGSSLVQVAHDSPAFVPELSLGDSSRHVDGSVAHALQSDGSLPLACRSRRDGQWRLDRGPATAVAPACDGPAGGNHSVCRRVIPDAYSDWVAGAERILARRQVCERARRVPLSANTKSSGGERAGWGTRVRRRLYHRRLSAFVRTSTRGAARLQAAV